MVRWTDDDHQMPPKQSLPADEVALLEQWVATGALDPRLAMAVEKPGSAEGDWWSLRPLVKSAGPAAAGNPLDGFIQAALTGQGLQPSPPADRRTLIRRVYFDLHGLAPTPEEVDAFVQSGEPQAYELLVDRLLASPRYGERWARHWLDTIHFADTHGYEHDVFRPNAWRFRDYVIASFNRDTPWDRFIREQVAADVIFPDEPHLAVALGFLGAGNLDISAANTAPMQFEYLDRDDLVTQTMSSFVSATAHCARCHDHKFDPVSQEDYFALQAVFAGITKGNINYYDDPSTTRAQRRLSSSPSSHSMVGRSRWLVGSSSSRMSGEGASTRASAARRASPPETCAGSSSPVRPSCSSR
jgi:hypothetical protein